MCSFSGFVLSLVDPKDREATKAALSGGGSGGNGGGGTSAGGTTAAAASGPARPFHESLRGLRAEHAARCVAELREAVEGPEGCLVAARPTALALLRSTLDSFSLGWNRDGFSITAVDAKRRADFIEHINRPPAPAPAAEPEAGGAEEDELARAIAMSAAEAARDGPTLVSLLLREVVAYYGSERGGEAEGVRCRLELIALLHRCCGSLALRWADVEALQAKAVDLTRG